MPIQFECPVCRRPLRAPDQAAGRHARCPQCGATVPVPAAPTTPRSAPADDFGPRADDLTPQAPQPAAASATRPCPYCGQQILPAAIKCRFCGEFLESALPPIQPHEPPPYPPQTYVYGPSADDRVRNRIRLPAIFLIVVASLGILADAFNVVIALNPQPQLLDPRLPAFFRNMQAQQAQMGALVVIIPALFLAVSALILFGAIQMLRLASYPLAMTAAILALINIGNCCCLLGFPFGIWALVVLSRPEVKHAFRQTS